MTPKRTLLIPRFKNKLKQYDKEKKHARIRNIPITTATLANFRNGLKEYAAKSDSIVK